MDFLARLLLCGLLAVGAFFAAYANRRRARTPGQSLFAFLLESDNFSDWGKVWRLVCLVSFLAAVAVASMKMVAFLLGGPIVDLDRLK